MTRWHLRWTEQDRECAAIFPDQASMIQALVVLTTDKERATPLILTREDGPAIYAPMAVTASTEGETP